MLLSFPTTRYADASASAAAATAGFATPLFLFLGGRASVVTPAATVDLREALVSLLLAESDVTDLVGDRIRPGIRAQDEVLPAITYTVITNPRGHWLTAPNRNAQARVQLDCWSADVAECMALKQAVEAVLDGYAGVTPAGLRFLWVGQLAEQDLHEAPQDASDRWIYRTMVEYRIKHRTFAEA